MAMCAWSGCVSQTLPGRDRCAVHIQIAIVGRLRCRRCAGTGRCYYDGDKRVMPCQVCGGTGIADASRVKPKPAQRAERATPVDARGIILAAQKPADE